MTRDQLERQVRELTDTALLQSERIAEMEVQTRFLMNAMRMIKPGMRPSTVIGVDGKPARLATIDGHEAYTRYGGRQQTLDILSAELRGRILLATAMELIEDHGDTRPIHEILTALAAKDHQRDRDGSGEDGGGSDPHAPSDAAVGHTERTRVGP